MRAWWKKLPRKSILRELNLRFVFSLFWCLMCHPGAFCPAKCSVLVMPVPDKNRKLQEELFCNFTVSRLCEKRNKITKASSFFQFWGDWKVNCAPLGLLSVTLVSPQCSYCERPRDDLMLSPVKLLQLRLFSQVIPGVVGVLGDCNAQRGHHGMRTIHLCVSIK